MSRFTLGPKVERDLDEIWDYIAIERHHPVAADRQIEMLYAKFRLLADNPLLGETREDLGKNLRAFVARPYLILYRVKKDGVGIFQVVHSARDIQAVVRRPENEP
jgi:plasmid stabilization system protein ParE